MSSKAVGEWTLVKVSDKDGGPGARSSHGVSVIDDVLYVFGGEKVPRVPVDSTMWCVSLADQSKEKSWGQCNVTSETSTVPVARLAHAHASIGDWIYIFGGRLGITMDESPLNDLHRFNVKSGVWENVTGTPTASARSFHRMVCAGDSTLYVFGGCGADGRLADLHRIVIDSNGPKATWTELATPKIKGRGGAGFAASVDGKRLFVIGGFVGEESAEVHIYNIAANEWKTVSPTFSVFRPRSVFVTATMPSGQLFVFGGEVSPSDNGHEGAGGFENDVILFNDGDAMVTTVAPKENVKPQNRGWSSADVFGKDAVVMFGGLSGSDEAPERLGDVWIYQNK